MPFSRNVLPDAPLDAASTGALKEAGCTAASMALLAGVAMEADTPVPTGCQFPAKGFAAAEVGDIAEPCGRVGLAVAPLAGTTAPGVAVPPAGRVAAGAVPL